MKYAYMCGGDYYKCATWTLRRKFKRKHCCVFFLIWRYGKSNLNILCHVLQPGSPLCVVALSHFEQHKSTATYWSIKWNLDESCRMTQNSYYCHQFALSLAPSVCLASLTVFCPLLSKPQPPFGFQHLHLPIPIFSYPVCWFNQMQHMLTENKYLYLVINVFRYFALVKVFPSGDTTAQ